MTLPESWKPLARRRVVITFKPVVLVVDEEDDIVKDVMGLTQEELQDYINENWAGYVDPSLPEIERVYVLGGGK